MTAVCCYLWRGPRPFLPSYVNALARSVRHYLPIPHRFICVTDLPVSGFSAEVEVLPMPAAAQALGHIQTPESGKFPSSYRRLWTLSKEAKGYLGERVLVLDIDCIIVRDMRPLFAIDADFVGWNVRPPRGGPRRFGGGTWLHKTGTRTWVYDRFVANPSQAIAEARSAGYRGSDQAWISYCLAGSEPCWPEPSGIYCAQDWCKARRGVTVPVLSKRGRAIRGRFRTVYPAPTVPAGAIILHFNGSGANKPWNSKDEIVQTHWRPFFDAENMGHNLRTAG